MKFSEKRCAACEGDLPRVDDAQAQSMLQQLNGWSIIDGKLVKTFKFADFTGAIDRANKIAAIAEQEGHHPDLLVCWGALTVTIWTHAKNGLTENDFILAAKIDEIG